jgi:hypothetical protein
MAILTRVLVLVVLLALASLGAVLVSPELLAHGGRLAPELVKLDLLNWIPAADPPRRYVALSVVAMLGLITFLTGRTMLRARAARRSASCVKSDEGVQPPAKTWKSSASYECDVEADEGVQPAETWKSSAPIETTTESDEGVSYIPSLRERMLLRMSPEDRKRYLQLPPEVRRQIERELGS